jgi:hypothetical protein
MSRACASLLLLASAAAYAQSGFDPLFNGRDLQDFVVDTPGIWSVRDGVITGSSTGLKWNDFLRTRQQYGNFVLRLQFRLKDGIGNSGIQFRSKPVSQSHEVSGYQADIGEKYWGCLYDESRRNKVLAGPKADGGFKFQADGWNDYVITADGNRITLDLNGIRTVDFRESDASMDRTGFIALQVHSGPPTQIEFKDLHIKRLK